MNYKNFEYFLIITEEGSVTKAAQRLYVSQPSLSKYLRSLEEALGVQLFYRDSYPLQLTGAGKLYQEYAKDALMKEKALLQNLEILKNTETGTVTMGITVFRSSAVLPAALPKFKSMYPGIEVKVLEGSHQYMMSLMDHNKVDFCIFHSPNVYQGITFEHILNEKVLFCVRADHPLLKTLELNSDPSVITPISNEDFRAFFNEPFIMLKPGQNIRSSSQGFLDKLGIHPYVILETSNITKDLNSAIDGLGVTFAQESALYTLRGLQSLKSFIVDSPPLEWGVGFAYKSETPPGNLARLLMNCLRSTMLELHQPPGTGGRPLFRHG